MKKFVAILLTVLMFIPLAACGGEKESAEGETPDEGNTTENVAGEAASTGNDSAENISEPDTPEVTVENEQAVDEAGDEPVNEEEGLAVNV